MGKCNQNKFRHNLKREKKKSKEKKKTQNSEELLKQVKEREVLGQQMQRWVQPSKESALLLISSISYIIRGFNNTVKRTQPWMRQRRPKKEPRGLFAPGLTTLKRGPSRTNLWLYLSARKTSSTQILFSPFLIRTSELRINF